MEICSLSISAFYSVLSFIGLHLWTVLKLAKLREDGLVGDHSIYSRNAGTAWELLLGSYATVALLANFSFSLFTLLILCLKALFFGKLYVSESRKLVERLVNYVIYKGAFFPLVIPPTRFQAGLWSSWLIVLCSLKMVQALARDRLERLNASPSTTSWTYSRAFSVLPLVLFVDILWLKLCWEISGEVGPSLSLLLFFEPFSILFDTLQSIVVHGFQLLDIRLHHSGISESCCVSKYFDLSPAGSLWEWKGILTRNLGFSLDTLTLLMALGHYGYIWWLHGLALHLVDLFLLLNIRALVSAIVKRVRGFIRLRVALYILHGALPDATSEELQAFDDECAICREPMAKAKKLACNHFFHLACLRSWLDQGLNDVYSCPTCRKPLFVSPGDADQHRRDGLNDEQLARQISLGLDHERPVQIGLFPNLSGNHLESGSWRSAGLDSSWLHSWPNPDVDGAGSSNGDRSVRFGRVQMMMRQLAAVGESYAQTALEETSWNLWPLNPSPPASAAAVQFPTGDGGLHTRPASDNVANMLAMAETVHEVLPQIPEDLIFQDLHRTNSVAVTVNNLLQM